MDGDSARHLFGAWVAHDAYLELKGSSIHFSDGRPF
jgi:hypothetical protein